MSELQNEALGATTTALSGDVLSQYEHAHAEPMAWHTANKVHFVRRHH
jgi:hypothetical protein